jgi:hypothetical protein
MPDWRRQALMKLSPAAGSPVCANLLELEARPLPSTMAVDNSYKDMLGIEASVVSAEAGRSYPVVRMAAGTYINRMALRLVPKGSDYAKVVAGITLWELPDWAREGEQK